jgi:hypothetical protein
LHRAGFIAVALLMTLAIAGVARAEVERDGDVIVVLDGGISPRALPRTGVAPVTVTLDSTFKSAEDSVPTPQLRTIAIGINRGGTVFDRGLPTCRVRRIQPTTIKAARRICGNAIVGSGHVQVLVHLANQPPFTFEGPLLVFHAQPAEGHRRLLAQVYGRKPPSAFVLTFNVLEKQGTFGTVIKTNLPKPARQWAFVTHFDMKLHRVYTYQGQKYSFISAGCAAPEGFPGAVYPFARANFGFAENQHVVTTLIRDCTVS